MLYPTFYYILYIGEHQQLKLSKKLSGLVNYIQAVHFQGFATALEGKFSNDIILKFSMFLMVIN